MLKGNLVTAPPQKRKRKREGFIAREEEEGTIGALGTRGDSDSEVWRGGRRFNTGVTKLVDTYRIYQLW